MQTRKKWQISQNQPQTQNQTQIQPRTKKQPQSQNQPQTPKDLCSYIANKKLSYKGIKNTIIFFQAENQKQLVCFQMFVKNGQMKIIKHVRVEHYGITFMNNGNYFINSNSKSLSIWKLDIFQNWHQYKTILEFEVECQIQSRFDVSKIYGLSNQDDQIVASDLNRAYFLQKDNNGDWKCNQILYMNPLYYSKFNEQGDILIANAYYQCSLVILKKRKNKHWDQTQMISIQKRIYEPFCFLEDNQFTFFNSESGFLTLWEINSADGLARKTSETKILNNQKILKDMKCVQSKGLLIAISRYCFYLIKLYHGNFRTKKFALVTDDFQITYCKNKDFLFFSQRNKLVEQSKIFAKRIHPI